jgi:hypothetical protein
MGEGRTPQWRGHPNGGGSSPPSEGDPHVGEGRTPRGRGTPHVGGGRTPRQRAGGYAPPTRGVSLSAGCQVEKNFFPIKVIVTVVRVVRVIALGPLQWGAWS